MSSDDTATETGHAVYVPADSAGLLRPPPVRWYGPPEIPMVTISKAELEQIGTQSLHQSIALAFAALAIGCFASFIGSYLGLDPKLLSDRVNATYVALNFVSFVLSLFFSIWWCVTFRAYRVTLNRAKNAPLIKL